MNIPGRGPSQNLFDGTAAGPDGDDLAGAQLAELLTPGLAARFSRALAADERGEARGGRAPTTAAPVGLFETALASGRPAARALARRISGVAPRDGLAVTWRSLASAVAAHGDAVLRERTPAGVSGPALPAPIDDAGIRGEAWGPPVAERAPLAIALEGQLPSTRLIGGLVAHARGGLRRDAGDDHPRALLGAAIARVWETRDAAIDVAALLGGFIGVPSTLRWIGDGPWAASVGIGLLVGAAVDDPASRPLEPLAVLARALRATNGGDATSEGTDARLRRVAAALSRVERDGAARRTRGGEVAAALDALRGEREAVIEASAATARAALVAKLEAELAGRLAAIEAELARTTATIEAARQTERARVEADGVERRAATLVAADRELEAALRNARARMEAELRAATEACAAAQERAHAEYESSCAAAGAPLAVAQARVQDRLEEIDRIEEPAARHLLRRRVWGEHEARRARLIEASEAVEAHAADLQRQASDAATGELARRARETVEAHTRAVDEAHGRRAARVGEAMDAVAARLVALDHDVAARRAAAEAAAREARAAAEATTAARRAGLEAEGARAAAAAAVELNRRVEMLEAERSALAAVDARPAPDDDAADADVDVDVDVDADADRGPGRALPPAFAWIHAGRAPGAPAAPAARGAPAAPGAPDAPDAPDDVTMTASSTTTSAAAVDAVTARPRARDDLDGLREAGEVTALLDALVRRGTVALERADWRAAVAALDEVAIIAEHGGDHELAAHAHIGVATALRGDGRLTAAAIRTTRALEVAPAGAPRIASAVALGECHRAAGDPMATLAAHDRALADASDARMRAAHLALLLRRRAEALAALGRTADAGASLATAAATFRRRRADVGAGGGTAEPAVVATLADLLRATLLERVAALIAAPADAWDDAVAEARGEATRGGDDARLAGLAVLEATRALSAGDADAATAWLALARRHALEGDATITYTAAVIATAALAARRGDDGGARATLATGHATIRARLGEATAAAWFGAVPLR